MENWKSKTWWKDTAERVITTFVYGLIALLALDVTGISWTVVWAVVALPTILSFLKAVVAGSVFANDDEVSPASLVRDK